MKNIKSVKITLVRTILIALAVTLLISAAGCAASGSAAAGGGNAGGEFKAGSDITVVSREDGSGTRGAFIELFGVQVKNEDGTSKDMTTKEAIIADKTDIMMTNIANDPYAVGYISLGSLNGSIKALNVDGVEATPANVKNGSYKIQRPFNIATKGEAAGVTADFIAFMLSKNGQEVVAKNNYIAIDDSAAEYTGAKPSGKIVVAGSSSVTPLMEKLREAYLAINTNAEIEIQMTDSSAGMTAAMNGTCQIGMASRELKDSEKAELKDIEIALDGIAVIVNNGNPNTDITAEAVKKIFTGETTKWQ